MVPDQVDAAQVVLLMGVSGSGKTTLGLRVSERLGWTFLDADDFHDSEARNEMAAGRPLSDTSRGQWIERLARTLQERLRRGEPTVLACSALRAEHRKQLGLAAGGRLWIAHLSGSPELIADRLRERKGHFAGLSLLESQFATLEPPEGALELDVSHPPDVLVDRIVLCFQAAEIDSASM